MKIGDGTWSLAVGLSILSGATALGHQLLWTRRLIDLLGASAESVSRVFGCFFLGLALGAAAAFWLAPIVRRPWRWLAAAEGGIFVLAAPVLFLPAWSAWIWPALGAEQLVGFPGAAIKFTLSILLVTPPAFLMGWFLPMLALAILGRKRSLQREGLHVYGWNTLGGVGGVAATALIILPALGAFGAMVAVMAVNLAAGAACLTLDRIDSQELPADEPAAPPSASEQKQKEWQWSPPLALGLSFLSGASVLGLEVAVLQMIMLVGPLSFYAPAIILFSVILLLALAAWLAAKLLARFSLATLVPWSLGAAGAITAATPLLFFWIGHSSGGWGEAGTLSGFFARMSLLTLLGCGPAFLVAGLVFPFLTAWSGQAGGDPGGKRWGLLLAVNGAGGLFGAEMAYRILLPAGSLFASAWWIGAGYAAAALVVWWCLVNPAGGRSSLVWWWPIAAAAIVLLLHAPVSSLSTVNPYVGLNVLAEKSGRDGTLAVVDRADFGRGILVYNQYMLGTTAARYDQERQAHLPLLLHAEPRDVAFIGLATGITPGAALQHDAVERITAIELSRTVVEFARDYFSDYNYGVVSDPRARVVVEDGRTFLAASKEAFDLVIGDLFLPWGPGEARLYSREHFAEVRASLRPGGIFCQWLPLFQLTPADLGIIVNTFHESFPASHWFVNTFQGHAPALALVGFLDSDLDWGMVEQRTGRERQAGGLLDPSMRHAESIGSLYLGKQVRAGDFAGFPFHTLNNMRVELQAGRTHVTGGPDAGYLAGQVWAERSRQLRERAAELPDQPDWLEQALRIGAMFTDRETRLRANGEWGSLNERALRRALPAELSDDTEADWARWPATGFAP